MATRLESLTVFHEKFLLKIVLFTFDLITDFVVSRHRSDHAQHGGYSSRHPSCLASPRPQLHQLQPRAETSIPTGAFRRRRSDEVAPKDPPVAVGADPSSLHAPVGGARRRRPQLIRLGRADHAQLAGRSELTSSSSWKVSSSEENKVLKYDKNEKKTLPKKVFLILNKEELAQMLRGLFLTLFSDESVRSFHNLYSLKRWLN